VAKIALVYKPKRDITDNSRIHRQDAVIALRRSVAEKDALLELM
jgi:hypothetical protein